MKRYIKNKISNLSLIAVTTFLITACSFDEQFDPNNPSINQVEEDATINELNNLAIGIESQMRSGLALYVTSTGTIARELYLFDADPRNTEELLGKNGGTLNGNTFYITAPYGGSYTNIKNANILIEAVDGTDLITETERSGYKGFANTIKALQMLRVLNMLGDNGIRIDVADFDDLGPFVSENEAHGEINRLLDEAYNQLQSAGDGFAFNLSAGFEGFDTPLTFALFNRALAARVAIYREDYSAVESLLSDSFYSTSLDSLNVGPKHSYSTASGDLLNGLYKQPFNNGDMIVVHNSFIEDAEEGDLRVAEKTRERENPSSQDDLNGTHETALYASPTSFIDIIRNEELILISAEAKLHSADLDGAIEDLNIIRDAAGLEDYAGAVTEEAVTAELLKQRRYSLWCEGHRMVDLRRYGLLNADYLPVDREGDQVFTQFPIPLTENE